MMMFLFLLQALAEVPEPASQALRRGDCVTALEALKQARGPDASLARASCGQLDPLTPELLQDPELGPYLRLLHARPLIEKDPARVEELLVDADLFGSADLEARLLIGRARIALNRSQDAKEDLRALLSTEVEPEARYWLAFGAESRGDLSPAIATYRATWSRHATSPWSDQAALRLEEMGHSVPDFSDVEGRQLALNRARALVKGGQAQNAVPLYDGLTHATGDTSATWTREVAFALFKARAYPRAVSWFERLGPEQGQANADVLFHYALALSRTGDYDAAARAYRRLVTLYPSTKRADTASYKLGYLEVDRNNLREAERELQAHLDRYPTSRHGDEALWYLGWTAFKDGRLQEAENHWRALTRSFPKSSLVPQARYWWARIHGMQGRPEVEQEMFQALVDQFPTSGAAFFAARELGLRIQGAGPAEVPALPESFLQAQPQIRTAQVLLRAGHPSWARELLRPAESAAARQGRTTSLALAHLAIEAGDGRLSTRLAAPWCGDVRKGGNPVALQACHPRPQADLVAQAAQKSGLHPLLPFAIMTAESGLQPEVTSPAGARGLMQVMPDLGAELHPLLFEGPYDPERLYDPGYNAVLGTTELGRLRTHWQSAPVQPSLPLVIAAYNGGADAVERWLATYASPPSGARFAEDISYSETRRYVRRVLGYLMTYRWVYGDAQ